MLILAFRVVFLVSQSLIMKVFSWALHFYLYFTHSSIMIKWRLPNAFLCVCQDKYTVTGILTKGVIYTSFYLATQLSNKELQFPSKHEICSKFLDQHAKIQLKHVFWVYVWHKSSNSVIKIWITVLLSPVYSFILEKLSQILAGSSSSIVQRNPERDKTGIRPRNNITYTKLSQQNQTFISYPQSETQMESKIFHHSFPKFMK